MTRQSVSGDDEDRIRVLARDHGFYRPAHSAYTDETGFYTFGRHGTRLKHNVENSWRHHFITSRGHEEIETPTVTPAAVLEASGHAANFDDMCVVCTECETAQRADHVVEAQADVEFGELLASESIERLFETEDVTCPACGVALAGEPVSSSNLLFDVLVGPEPGSPAFLRPETAQGAFVEHPFLEAETRRLPFAIGQVGRSYRNEVNPERWIRRLREFTHAELQHFVDPDESRPPLDDVADVDVQLYTVDAQRADGTTYERLTVGEAVADGVLDNEWLAYYVGFIQRWGESIGLDPERVRYRHKPEDERLHFAADAWDAEAETAGDWIELAGLVYRMAFTLAEHADHSGEEFTAVRESTPDARIIPHIAETSFGTERLLYVLLHHTYRREATGDGVREYFALPPNVAPVYASFLVDGDDETWRAVERVVDELRDDGRAVELSRRRSERGLFERQDATGASFAIVVKRTDAGVEASVRDGRSGSIRTLPFEDVSELVPAVDGPVPAPGS